MQNIKAADTGAPLDWFKNQGYYQVGDKVFSTKTAALQQATSTRQEPSWHFGKEEYSKVNWRQKTGLDIRALYRMRAQQLREKYDYLVLAWSGGADSTTALLSFLENGIRLDEIVTYWPYSVIRDKYDVTYDRSPRNIVSEWDLSIFPQMQALKSRFPHQKFTVLDEKWDSTVEDQDDTFYLSDHCPNYFVIQRYRSFDRFLMDREARYGNLTMIVGVGPCPLYRIDQYLCMYPCDIGTMVRTDYTDQYARRTEWFYLTPEFPELTREQAHLMLDYFRQNPSHIQNLQHLTMGQDLKLTYQSRGDTDSLRMIYKKTCYPDYDSTTFQVKKPKSLIEDYDYGGHFLRLPGINTVLEAWQSHLNSQLTTINPKYCRFNNGKLAGFNPLYTRPYVIGQLPSVE